MAAVLDATGLGKRYALRRWGLRNCSFAVPAGRVVALVGANGSGKSTLLRLAAGLTRPTEGVVRVDGVPTYRRDALSRVAYVGQTKPLYPGFTVAEMVRFGTVTNPAFDKRGTLERLRGLGIPLDRTVSRLSGGQRTQVAIALALGKRADVVLLDEPMADLDPLARPALLGELMATVEERACTVLLSSHVLTELTDVCDSLLLMNEGALQVSGLIDDLIAGHRLLVGPVEAYSDPGRVGAHAVVSARTTERQATVLVEWSDAPIDPRWVVHPVTLTDVVLGYLRSPDATIAARPRQVPA
ncbi:ABC transporter ATP-binding protein [Cryptosporangium minutisporangium]|uniref:ABC transporter ATP-binding protein n=1 Tax=Cryptosporangium minutisporangium TaxID=113569 RepID=A0ABP6TDG9_9ACTN